MTHSLSAVVLLCSVSLVVACASGDGASGGAAYDAGTSGDTAARGDDGSDGGDAADAVVDPEVADEALATPEIDSTRTLLDLTEPELAIVCEAQVRWERSFDREIRAFRCLADATDATFSADDAAPDPVLTCSRLDEPCMSGLALEEQMAAIGVDIAPSPDDDVSELDIATCMTWFQLRTEEICEDPTLLEYKVRLLRNAELERTVLDRRSLTCNESMPLGTIRPDGRWECACGVPARLGFAPADDADWDGVPDADDACPESGRGFRVSAAGCTRYEDIDGDAVWDEEDVCPGTLEGAEGIDDQGCSLAQDTDQDRVPDVSDRCWDTAPGAELVSPGCSAAQDEDADGVPNAADWCPFTEPGAEVVTAGCAPDQGEPWNDHFVETLPPGVTVVELGDGSSSPIRFHVVPSGIRNETESAFDYDGTMLLDLGSYGFMQLPGSAVQFSDIDPTTGRPRAFEGRMPLPMPSVGLLQHFRLESTGVCDVTFGAGASAPIEELGLPVVAERYNLAVECDVALAAAMGRIRFTLREAESLVMLIDPLDPSTLFYTDISQFGIFDRIRNAGVAISNQGLIPYAPINTWGVEDHAEPFGGHLYAVAEVPVNTPLPSQLLEFTINGELAVNLDPEQDGGLDFGAMDARFGVNGDVRQVISLSPGLKLQVDLANASVGGFTGSNAHLWASGTVGPSALRLPAFVPIRFPAPARAAVYLSRNLERSYLVAETDMQFVGSQINLPLIPDFLDFGITATLRMDHEGIHFDGTVSGTLHEWLRVRGRAQISGFVGWNVREFRIEIQGDVVFRGDTAVSDLYFGNNDIRINGRSYLPF